MGTQQTGNEGQPAVSLRGLRKGFGEVTAVAGIDLDIADGEFFSMLGPSGSGKTTVLRLVAGFESPTAGTVSLKGRDVTRLAPFERDVTTVFQDYALFPHMSVLDNVAYGLRVRRTPRSRRRDMAATALDTVRLSGMESRRPHQLSGGQRQRVALARALVVDPAVLLLDEPLGALDLKLREQMQVELKEIQRRVGITFVFVTHDQEEALTMSDRIAVFRHGAVEQLGTPAEVYERPRTQFVAAFVGTSNLITGDAARRILGRDGAYNVRPEKIQLTTDVEQKPTDDEAFVVGRVTEVSYAGVVTRFVVDVDGGPRMVAVQQNATVSSTQVHALRGRMVRLSWERRHSFAIEGSLENDLLEEAR